MFEEKKKYNSENFVIIRKEKVLGNKKFRPRPELPWSTFNYSIRTTLDGAKDYSLAFKIGNTYLDLCDLNTYSELDAFNCKVGDVVITEKESLSKDKNKLTCSEAIGLFILTDVSQFNRLKDYDEKKCSMYD